ncbi:MAG: IIA-like nitrogen regulatory protein PtsN [Pseudomonadota bacterium]|jgi:PTS system nitrogen regulatory IIA component
MMNNAGFADLVDINGIAFDCGVASKQDLLATMAAMAGAALDIPASLVLERVRQREALGTTGFGQGAAIPHARIEGLTRVMAVVARLPVPIAYGSFDGQPIDLAILLLSPEGAGADHLKALARISRTLRDPAILAAMRTAVTEAELRAAIGPPQASDKRAA